MEVLADLAFHYTTVVAHCALQACNEAHEVFQISMQSTHLTNQPIQILEVLSLLLQVVPYAVEQTLGPGTTSVSLVEKPQEDL